MVASAVDRERNASTVTGDGYASEGEVLQGRRAGRREPDAASFWAASPRFATTRSCGSEDGVWKVEGDPTEGALYPFAAKLGTRSAEGAGRLSPDRRHPVRVRAPIHGDPARDARGRRGSARQGRAGSHPRPLRPAGGRDGTAPAARSRPFRDRPPTRLAGARRARAGAGVAARSRSQGGEPRSGGSAEDPRPARSRRVSWIRRARKRSRR